MSEKVQIKETEARRRVGVFPGRRGAELGLLMVVVVVLSAVGCGSEGEPGNVPSVGICWPGIQTSGNGKIEVDYSGGAQTFNVEIHPTDCGKPYEIFGFELSGDEAFQFLEIRRCDETGCEDSWTANQESLEELGEPIALITEELSTSYLEVVVSYDPAADTTRKGANFRVLDRYAGWTQVTSFEFPDEPFELGAVPSTLVFGIVETGETSSKEFTVMNKGETPVFIYQIEVKGQSAFSVEFKGEQFPEGIHDLKPEWVIAPSATESFVVTFAPENDSPSTGEVILAYHGGSWKWRKEFIALGGNGPPGNGLGPQLIVSHELVDFGPSLVGLMRDDFVTLKSVGTSPVLITGISLNAAENAGFQFDYVSGVDIESGHLPAPESPLILDVGESVTLWVSYIPEEPSPSDNDGAVIPDTGTIIVISNAEEEETEILLKGSGILTLPDGSCPAALIEIEEGDQVIPQTVLHLSAQEHLSTSEAIDKWEWEVTQPLGSKSVFYPSADSATPTFETNVAGVYQFRLRVWDEAGIPGCFTDEVTVAVIPDEAIHVELLWSTPGDGDEADEGFSAGADLDLHFLHPLASGPDLDGDGDPDGWFDTAFDCFWYQANPEWGDLDPQVDDNPGLDREDSDGAGPENLNLNLPENGNSYTVGVHYWDDHGYGESYATVRIYVYSELVYELSEVEMVNQDLWEVATIDWPSGNVEPIENGFNILPAYSVPDMEAFKAAKGALP